MDSNDNNNSNNGGVDTIIRDEADLSINTSEKSIENGGLLKAAAEQGNLEKVKLLIEVEKVSPNQPDLFGDSALHGASAKGRLLIVEYLLEKKADPNIKNKVGSTPLHKAVTIDQSTITLSSQMSLIRVLLKRGADPTISNMAGLIPEQLATSIRIKEMLQGDQAVTIHLAVPKVHHGKIIGRNGKNLKELREVTNTQIQFPDSNVTDNKIMIKGRKDDVEKARQMILDIVNPPKTQEDIEAEELKKKEEEELEVFNLNSVPKEKHSLVIGAQGKTIKFLNKNFNVKVTVPPANSSESNIEIQGKFENIDNAIKHINEILKKNNEIKQKQQQQQQQQQNRTLNNNNNNNNNKNSNNNSNNTLKQKATPKAVV